MEGKNESSLRLFALPETGTHQSPLSQGTGALLRPKLHWEGPEGEDIHRAGGQSGGYLQGDTWNC